MSNTNKVIRETIQLLDLSYGQHVTVARQTLINVGRTQEVLLYSSVNYNIAHITVQLHPNDIVQQLCVILLIM